MTSSPAAITPGLPSRLVRSSSHLGWNAVRVEEYQDPAVAEPFVTRSDRLSLVRVTSGRYRIQSRHGRRWRWDDYRPGSLGITAPGNENVLRWRSSAPMVMRSQHLLLDPALVPSGVSFPDALALEDPYVTASAQALEAALNDQAPAIYADSVAAALVAHLVYRMVPGLPAAAARRLGALSPAEVDLVIGMMHECLAQDLTLDQLAALVGLSKYHFLRSFSAATGETPSRYLTQLRLEAAARMLRTTAEPVAAIASACGYRSSGQFAAAFRRHHGCTPMTYRKQTGP